MQKKETCFRNGITVDVSEKEIVFADEYSKQTVQNWLKEIRWELGKFKRLLELIGIDMPVCITKKRNSGLVLICESLSDSHQATEVRVRSDIVITIVPDETRRYYMGFDESAEYNLNLYLVDKVITQNGKVLRSGCSGNDIEITLEHGECKIEIKMSTLENLVPQEDKKILQGRDEVEKFLISDESSWDAETLYKKVFQFLGFSEKDLKLTEKVSFSCSETIGEKTIVRSKVNYWHGKLVEYVVTEDGKTYKLHENANSTWEYIDSAAGKMISFSRKEYCVTLIGRIKGLSYDVNETEIIEKRITELRKEKFGKA